MTAPINFYADFGKLAELKGSAQNDEAKTLREAARQFESLFTQMMLKSMREATQSLSNGESLMDNDQSNMYREMFDNQISMQLSKGRGLGLADMLVRQLTESGHSARTSGVGVAVAPVVKSTQPPTEMLPIKQAPERVHGMEGVHRGQPVKAAPYVPSVPAAVAPINKESVTPNPTSSGTIPGNGISGTTSSSVPAVRAQTLLAVDREQFIAQMLPHAEAAAKELGVDAKTLIAHAALETGWGKFVPCNPDGSCSFNLFGIKATGRRSDSWQGAATAVNTLEYEGGMAIKRRESFRAYDSPADSFRDYAALLKNSKRYVAALGAGDNVRAFASALQNGGYATDPNYADKLASVASALKNFLAAPLSSGSSVARGGSRT